MTLEQEKHRQRVIDGTSKRMYNKYRKGAVAHDGDLLSKTPLELCDDAIDEAVDNLVYLFTLREKLSP